MRTLKYAILGLLMRKDMTGYDLMQEFESTLNEFWSAKHSQIYPELKKLTEEGAISFTVKISGNVLEKKEYSITPSGKQDFLSWLSLQGPLGDTPKDIFRLRTFFLSHLSAQQRIAFLQHGLHLHMERLEHLRKNKEKFTRIPDTDQAEFGDYLVLTGAIMREETTCQWIEECIRLVELQ